MAELDGGDRWVLPGLWDHHVHVRQWGLVRSRLDLQGTGGVAEALERVRRRLAEGGLPSSGVITGWGHRPATWAQDPTVADLDGVTTQVPVVLISGDGHHGWLNTPALDLLGAPRRAGVVAEGEWFAVYERLSALPGAHEEAEAGVALALADALARGVVGITDLEFGRRGRTGATGSPSTCRRSGPGWASTPRGWTRSWRRRGCAPVGRCGPRTDW
ncbi:amidohydrolase family protein [Ornithinimicrobium sp. W1665]|uniref:amidohydrolase family protein n=1 Tax=Ornithinimicrobium sp. W1665 TaxID=3416666 RepID=UPI003D6B9EDD